MEQISLPSKLHPLDFPFFPPGLVLIFFRMQGVEEAFEVIGELAATVVTATFAGECMIFTDSGTFTRAHSERK